MVLCFSSSCRTLLRTLPTSVMGSSFLNSSSLIALYGATFSLTNFLISSSVAVIPSFSTMNALGISLAIGSGFPMTAQSFTAGCS